MSVGAQGAVEWGPECPDSQTTRACYPVWQYGESLSLLEQLCAENIGDDQAQQCDPMVDEQFWSKPGQEHRVVIGSYPDPKTSAGRRFMLELANLQEEYPACILHLFSATTLSPIFNNVRSGDIDPHTPAVGGSILLPNGRILTKDKFNKHRQWIHLMGFTVTNLMDSKEDRLVYNVKSAIYGAANWDSEEIFSTRSHQRPMDPDLLSLPMVRPTNRMPYRGVPVEGDKINCDSCSLSQTCKLYRASSVCTLPNSETRPLAMDFKTRDSNRIIANLGEVLSIQASRAQVGMEYEDEAGELDPEVSRILKTVVDGGVKLAKLVDPTLAAAGAARIGIQVNANHNAVSASNPQALMAQLVKELEAKGVPRDEITPEMVVGLSRERAVLDVVPIERES